MELGAESACCSQLPCTLLGRFKCPQVQTAALHVELGAENGCCSQLHLRSR